MNATLSTAQRQMLERATAIDAGGEVIVQTHERHVAESLYNLVLGYPRERNGVELFAINAAGREAVERDLAAAYADAAEAGRAE